MKKEKSLLFKRLFTVPAVLALVNGLIYAQSDIEFTVSNLTVSSLQDVDIIASNVETSALSENDEVELNKQIEESIRQTPAVNFNYKDTKEWQKYKTLRAIGWSFLGVSPVVTIIGFSTGLAGGLSCDPRSASAGSIICITGIIMGVSSVPILICAYNYRAKAKKMNANLGISYINTQLPSAKDFSTPALSFTLNF